MLSAAGSLEWLHERLAPDAPFEQLDAEAEAWPPGAEGLLFAPYLAGERTPHADPDVRGAFVGLQLRHDRGALVRAVLEGVAFGLRDSLDAVRGLGVDVSVGRVSGGGARSVLWLRIVASVLDLRARADRVGGGVGVRRRAARRRRRRGLCRRAPGGLALRPATHRDRARAAVARPVRRPLALVPRPLSGAPALPVRHLGRRLSDLLAGIPLEGRRRLTIQSYDISIGRHRSAGAPCALARDKEVGRCE